MPWNPDMPWNEEIRASWARHERLAASPKTVSPTTPLVAEMDVRAVLPAVGVPTLVVQHADDFFIAPAGGQGASPIAFRARSTSKLPGRNMWHFVEPWRASFHEIAEFLTGQQARRWPTTGFSPPCSSPTSWTRRAGLPTMGDRDWHALLDAHDAVVRVQLDSVSRSRGEHVGRQFPRDVRRSSASDPLRHGNS